MICSYRLPEDKIFLDAQIEHGHYVRKNGRNEEEKKERKEEGKKEEKIKETKKRKQEHASLGPALRYKESLQKPSRP